MSLVQETGCHEDLEIEDLLGGLDVGLVNKVILKQRSRFCLTTNQLRGPLQSLRCSPPAERLSIFVSQSGQGINNWLVSDDSHCIIMGVFPQHRAQYNCTHQ